VVKWVEWKAEQVRRLESAGIEYPEDELLYIISILNEKARSTIHFDKEIELSEALSEDVLSRFERVISGRIRREPLAYLLGEVFFYRDRFFVGPGVLVPRPDSEILVGASLYSLGVDDSFLAGRYEDISALKVDANVDHLVLLDLCTGSGCIGISIANILSRYLLSYQMVLTEISEEAAQYARRNIEEASEPDRIALEMCDLFPEQEYFLTTYGKAAFIVSNPPYITDAAFEDTMPEVRIHEPALALRGGSDGLQIYRRILDMSPKYLSQNGILAFEHGFDQRGAISELMQSAGFSDVVCLKDFGGNDRVTLGRFRGILS